MSEQFERAREAYFGSGKNLSWYRGWEACYAGLDPIADNPYEQYNLAWQNWGEGWIAAYAYEQAKEGGWLDGA